jgi:hypothetical protein
LVPELSCTPFAISKIESRGGGGGISLNYNFFLLNDMRRKIPDIKKTIEREERGKKVGKGTCECV